MAKRCFSYGAAALYIQVLTACAPESTPSDGQQVAQHTTSPQPESGNIRKAPLVVVFGDSLFAGYGLGPDEGFAPTLERALAKEGVPARVFNAGVSGDTSAAGRQRLAFVLDGLDRKPDLFILGLGANDMLRGLSPEDTRTNLEAILAELKKRGIATRLTGMLAAPNMGPDYASKFNPIYPELASKYDIELDPFFLDGVIGQRSLLLEDGIHPNAQGITRITARIAPGIAADLRE